VLAPLVTTALGPFDPARLDGERADQAQTTVRIRKDPHHECPPFDFVVQPLQHIRRLQVFVMRPRLVAGILLASLRWAGEMPLL
jgi:hypothetical protein